MVGVGQTPSGNGNDRSRTYWTPTMERFFIDLMLDQMHSGARVGHTFNKQAWTEMLAVFNKKFGSQYDKDVLKSRYTNLWKQFNDVKTLLAHNGFSWDEPRQMVVAADDFLWDSYIKAHPEARAYKTKAVLNFKDLSVLYSYTTADGRYSRSSHDVDFDDEMHGMCSIGGEGMYSLDSSSNNGGGRQRTDWTSEMDHYFIELMLDQIGRRNELANTFNKQAWADMLSLFNAKFGPHHGKRVLRHRHKKLSKYYSDTTILLKQQGFSWSETQRMVVADDQVWDSYTKAHPHTRSYRTKSLPNYYDLNLIFGNGFEIGSNSCSNPEQNPGNNVARQRISGKGKGGPTSDRTRTYWTPSMDRYLVDLLLDHVHRGNKLGQTFTSQAWTDMAASFNTHFKSCHDKDVLKNRYKHLRRQYNDMKLLLEQSGFSWDETREMILAEDPAWDAYTKVHPDARTYRVKTFPGFHKLCAIFGEEQFDGRYSRLARDSGLTCEFPELIANEERNAHYDCAMSSSINWTPQMDCFLMDLMSQQVQQRHKLDDVFDERAWAFMLDSFHKSYGHLCNKRSLEDRYIWLKSQYEIINKLLCCDGFMWDEDQQMVIADDDVWEAYIKEHPDAVAYRNTCLSSYRDLHRFFQSGETVESINGQLAEMIFDDHGFEMIRDCHIPETSTLEIGVEEVFSLPLSTEDICKSERQRKRSSPRPLMESGSGQCRKVQKTGSETLSEVAGLVAELVSKNEDMNDRPMASAIDTLQAMPGLDDELLLDACDLLEDERKAKTFLALDASLRKKWLLRKLRPVS